MTIEEKIKEERRDEAPVEEGGGEKKLIKYLILAPLLILVLVVVAGILGGEGNLNTKQPRPLIGDPARDFTFPDLEGKPVSLSDFYGKKVVFVNVWATWCTVCRSEMPTMQAMYNSLKGDDFEVLAVSIDALGAKAIKPYMQELRLTFPVLQDTTGSIQQLYGTTGVPESFLVDKQGRVAFVEVGPGDWSRPDKQAEVRSLMAEPDA